jgi:hypothetical protein
MVKGEPWCAPIAELGDAFDRHASEQEGGPSPDPNPLLLLLPLL